MAALSTRTGHAGALDRRSLDADADAWISENEIAPAIQVDEGELVFLEEDAEYADVLHSLNVLTISAASLEDGWVQIEQCYRNLDAVSDAEVVYAYREMRGLRIVAQTHIANAFVQGNSVQLVDVERAATLCIEAEARVLNRETEGVHVLRNGPFHRKFLDGYFPLRVTVEVRYPAGLLRVIGTSPGPQPGFEVEADSDTVRIAALFAGMLHTEVRFGRLPGVRPRPAPRRQP